MTRCGFAAGRSLRWAVLASALIALFGCGDGPRTHTVKGKVVFTKGDIKQLAGSTLVCQHEQDPMIQAMGDITEDGTFALQTRAQGKILHGAIEGKYRAWIMLSSENEGEESQFRKSGIDPRFLVPNASGLTLTVPSDGEITLTVTRGKPGARFPQPKEPQPDC